MVRLSIGLLAAAALVSPVRADGPYDHLLKYAPSNANALVLIDMKGGFASPLAKKENWLEKGQPNNRGGLGFLPAEADTVVIAADINLNSLTRNFQVGLVKLRYNVPPMGLLAAREGGTHDEIAGRATVLSPRDVYYTEMSGSVLAAVYPADRQNTARWLRSVLAGKEPPLSPYLKSAATNAGSTTVTIALDLEDVVDRTILRMSLPASPSAARNRNLDLAGLATVMAKVKGMTFKARIDQTITATLTWDFGLDPKQFSKTLPNMILELLDGQGVAIPDLDIWPVTFTDTSMTFSGTLSSRDLKRIVSLFAFPTVSEDSTEPAPKEDDPTNPPKKKSDFSLAATKRYLSTVTAIADDLRKTTSDPYYGKTAAWHEKAAAQIANLSRQKVDPAAVAAALEVSKQLQSIGGSLRGVSMDVTNLASQSYAVTYRQTGIMPGGWWGWRPYLYASPLQLDTNIPQVQAAIAKVIEDDTGRRLEAWSQINRVLVETRRALSDKYKTQF